MKLWNCRDILIQGITIIAPITSPNTDGINPGSVTSLILVKAFSALLVVNTVQSSAHLPDSGPTQL